MTKNHHQTLNDIETKVNFTYFVYSFSSRNLKTFQAIYITSSNEDLFHHSRFKQTFMFISDFIISKKLVYVFFLLLQMNKNKTTKHCKQMKCQKLSTWENFQKKNRMFTIGVLICVLFFKQLKQSIDILIRYSGMCHICITFDK